PFDGITAEKGRSLGSLVGTCLRVRELPAESRPVPPNKPISYASRSESADAGKPALSVQPELRCGEDSCSLVSSLTMHSERLWHFGQRITPASGSLSFEPSVSITLQDCSVRPGGNGSSKRSSAITFNPREDR